MLGKFQENPSLVHWKHLKQVICYLDGTVEHGLTFPISDESATLRAWSDADWAHDCTNRRSRAGYILTVSGCPVIWSSKLQTATALSNFEAEFFSLSQCTREVMCVRELLEELEVKQCYPTAVFKDNLGTISWTEDMQWLRKVKHIGIKYHYIRDSVQAKIVQVKHVNTQENRSDSLKKVLVGDDFKKHGTLLGVIASPVIHGGCRSEFDDLLLEWLSSDNFLLIRNCSTHVMMFIFIF